MDPLTQFLTLLLTSMSGVLPGSTQNQMKLQQQTANRQLSASDFANDPNQFMARLSNMLGVRGGSAEGLLARLGVLRAP